MTWEAIQRIELCESAPAALEIVERTAQLLGCRPDPGFVRGRRHSPLSPTARDGGRSPTLLPRRRQAVGSRGDLSTLRWRGNLDYRAGRAWARARLGGGYRVPLPGTARSGAWPGGWSGSGHRARVGAPSPTEKVESLAVASGSRGPRPGAWRARSRGPWDEAAVLLAARRIRSPGSAWRSRPPPRRASLEDETGLVREAPMDGIVTRGRIR